MSRIGKVLVFSLIGGLVFFAACQQDRKKPRPAETESVVAAEPSVELAREEQEAAAAAEAATVRALTEKVETADAPDYLKKMVEHLNEIIRLTRENLSDCAKAEEQIGGYVKSNQEEMTALSRTMEEAAKKMADPDKLKLAQQLMTLMAPTVEDTQKVMTEFAQKCPAQAAVVGEAMSALKAKSN